MRINTPLLSACFECTKKLDSKPVTNFSITQYVKHFKKQYYKKEFIVKKTLCSLVSSLVLAGGLLFSGGCSLPQKVSFDNYKQLKEKKVASKVDCAILVAKPRDWYEHLRVPFEFVYEDVVASELKEKLEIKGYTITFNATWKDLQDILKDPSIQTIIVAGHGKWYDWCASDRAVTEDMLDKFMKENNLPKKNGFFIRHTCGNDRYGYCTPHLLDNFEYSMVLKSLAACGARDIIVDDSWTDDDACFAKKRSRISYVLVPNCELEKLERFVDYWNFLMAERGKGCERKAFGSSIVNHPSKTCGYEGIVGPWDYLTNPIPETPDTK